MPKNSFSPQLAGRRLRRVEPARDGQLRRRREVEHVLHLGHVGDLDPIQDVQPLLHGVDLVAVEVGRPLLELGEVLDRAQAPLRPVDLLVEQPAQAHRVQPKAPLLRPMSGVEVELARGVAVDVAVEAGHAQAGLSALLRSSVGLNSSCGNGVSSSRRPSSCTGVRMSLNRR